MGSRAARALARCDGLFFRHGTRAVLLARLTPLARTFVSLPAGHARVGIASFVGMTALGCAIWAAALVSVGMVVGAGWREVGDSIGIPMLLVGAIVVAGSLLKGRGGDSA